MLSEKTSMWKKSGKILQGKKDSWKQWCRKQSAARLIDVGKIVENNKKKYWQKVIFILETRRNERRKNKINCYFSSPSTHHLCGCTMCENIFWRSNSKMIFLKSYVFTKDLISKMNFLLVVTIIYPYVDLS